MNSFIQHKTSKNGKASGRFSAPVHVWSLLLDIILPFPVNKQPVRSNMALTAACEISDELMVMIFFIQRNTGSQQVDHIPEELHIVAALFHQPIITFEFAGVVYFEHGRSSTTLVRCFFLHPFQRVIIIPRSNRQRKLLLTPQYLLLCLKHPRYPLKLMKNTLPITTSPFFTQTTSFRQSVTSIPPINKHLQCRPSLMM